MRHLKRVAVTVAAAFVVFSSTAALAAPVTFTFTSGVGSTNIPGTAAGDTFRLTVIADNGNASWASQVWFGDDVVSGTIRVGSYSALLVEVLEK